MHGAGFLVLAQLLKFSINILSVVVLSRLLSPSEVGIAAMGWAIIGIGEILRDFGLSSSVIRSENIAKTERSNLFWVNSCIGVLLAGITLLLSIPIAAIFATPELAAVLAGLSSVFIFNGLSSQYRADLNRRMKFRIMGILDIVPQMFGFAVAIYLASTGFGYWAIIWQYVLAAAMYLALVAPVAGWIPGLPSRTTSIRHHLLFGWRVAASQGLSYIGNNVDTFALGLFSTPIAVGHYSRAFQLVMSPLNQLRNPANSIAVPALAKLTGDVHGFERLLLRGGRLIGYGILPIAAIMAVAHEPIINIILGQEWSSVASIFAILSIAGGMQQLSSIASWTFLTVGDGKQLQLYSLIALVVKSSLILVAAPHGALPVAFSYLVSVCILWPVVIVWSLRSAGIPVRGILFQSFRMIALAVVSAYLSFILISFGDYTSWIQIGTVLAVFITTYASANILQTYRRDIGNVISDLSRMIFWKVGRPNP